MPVLLRFLLGLVMATVVFVLGLRVHAGFPSLVDPFLIFTVYHGLRHRPLASAFGGSAAGLVQDTLTGGLYGLHGFANTAVAYAVSWVRQRFVIQQPSQVGVIGFLAAAFQSLLSSALQLAMVADAELPSVSATLASMVSTGVLCALVFAVAEQGFAWEKAAREKRNRRLRLDT